MTPVKEKLTATIAAYDALVLRAVAVAAENNQDAENPEFARLFVEGDTATLIWPEDENDGYGWSGLVKHQHHFPASLLLLTDAEFSAWVADKQQARKEAFWKRTAEEGARKRAAERALYEQLKAKFEATTPQMGVSAEPEK